MTTDRTADGPLSPVLEAIAAAAYDRLHAQAGADLSAIDQTARRVAEAASAAIGAGVRLSAIAAAAQVSHGTIRALLTRASTITDNGRPAEEQPLESEPDELAA